ncbi:CGNR zinc finger domain-containing protein [Streptomyces kaniharaensis]|uniref:CGNR zinc finger domain-containing protein n=1 Tax=Streptomyces kaniharaensis TaxID=212423 RepID=A0A6N7KXX8_9ACTN|nr:CGNR zinc finger domain-containing protein [Streptomyces kaniharaensis]MQS16351.1 CGNR zinc finger domain-containing protein [Streptomyces kaniharaensis]
MDSLTASKAPAGSAPPLAVAFANTLVATRGKVRDTLATPDDLTAWLAVNTDTADAGAPGATVGEADLARFRALRDAIRAVLRAFVDAEPAPAAEIERINEASAAAPHWPVLAADTTGYTVTPRTDRAPVPAALGALAHDTAALLAGPLAADLRACHGPGCVQFFVKDHPRRQWCGPGCGNRARAARHYHRQRSH